jgi:hypothetical protein
MKKSLRAVLLAGVLTVLAAPVFADGPGGTDPSPPPADSNGTVAAIVLSVLSSPAL